MRNALEGYRWVWGAIRRWRGGPAWARFFLFSAFVVRDLVPAPRKLVGAGGVVGAAFLTFILIWPTVERPGHRHVEIDLFSDGAMEVNGEESRGPDLKDFLTRYSPRTATVSLEADVTSGTVDQIQKVLVKNGIQLVRFESIGDAGSRPRKEVILPPFRGGSS